jgi:hypothetical protein
MRDEDDGLATKIREMVRSGQLPDEHPVRVWTGFGPGSDRCHACGALIPADQVVMEAVFGSEEATSLFFHRRCFDLVDSEWSRTQRAIMPGTAPTGASTAGANGAEADEQRSDRRA